LIGSADAFILTSRGEGWGLPVMEAMAMALPVIVPNHTGLSAFCTPTTTYLVHVDESVKDKVGFPKLSSERFAETLRRVLSDSATGKAEEVGKLARRNIIRNWSPRVVVSQIVARIKYLSKLKWG
jgi:glycosyltransferase involved in cell wall biosynthesis